MIQERWIRMQFRFHLAACVLLVASVVRPHLLLIPAAIMTGFSALLLEANLLSAVWRYLRHGGRLT